MSTLKWGLVGYGDLAEKRVASALQSASGSELSGVWGRSPQRTQDFAARHGIASAFDSLEDLVRSDVDAVYVCTPPESHLEYSLAALNAGKHLLVEKPMASSVEDCSLIIEAAQANQVTLGVAYYRRGYPKMQKIKELIDGGVLGIPTWVNIAAHSWFAPNADDPKHWRVEKAQSAGGGAVADIGVHRFDLLDYWLGPSKVLFSDAQRLVHKDAHYEVEDGLSAVLQLKNGAPVHIYFSWNSKTWLDRFEIVGSEGKIITDPLDGPSLVVVRGREREELQIEPPANAHVPCVENFVKAVENNTKPLCDGEAGMRANQLLQSVLSV